MANIFCNTPESDYNQLFELFGERKHQLSPGKAHYLLNEAIPQDKTELLAYVVILQPDALLTNTSYKRVAETVRLLNEAQPLAANPQWAAGFDELHRKILQGCIVELESTGEYLTMRLPYAQSQLYQAVDADLKARFSQYANSLQISSLTTVDKHSIEGTITQLRLASKGNKVLIWSSLGEDQEVSLYDFDSGSKTTLVQEHFVWGRWSLNSNQFALDIRTKGWLRFIEDWQFIFYDEGGNILSEIIVHQEPFVYSLLGWVDSKRIYGVEMKNIFMPAPVGLNPRQNFVTILLLTLSAGRQESCLKL